MHFFLKFKWPYSSETIIGLTKFFLYGGRGQIGPRRQRVYNWTQEPNKRSRRSPIKGYGPRTRPARDWPVPKSASVQWCARTRIAGMHCAVQRWRSWPVRNFSKSAIFIGVATSYGAVWTLESTPMPLDRGRFNFVVVHPSSTSSMSLDGAVTECWL